MNSRRFLIALFMFVSVTLSAQTTHKTILIHGKILNVAGNDPIPFANIGILNSSIGTISNADGSFTIKIPVSYSRESVIFSALGYGHLKIPVADMSGTNFYTVFLKESPTQLKTVVITGDTWKNRNYRAGNRRYEGSCLYADTEKAGSAMALKINTDDLVGKNHFDYPVFLKEAQLMIVHNTFGEFKVRTRINAIDPDTGYPGKDLLDESVITRSGIENGRIRVDLSPYNIRIDGEFFLTFEWILDENDRNYLFSEYEGFRQKHPDKVSTDYIGVGGEKVPYTNYQGNLYAGPSFAVSLTRQSIENNTCYYRLNSFGKWNRSLFIVAGSIILADQPGAVNDTEDEMIVFDDQAGGMMPYYRIDRRMHPTGPDVFTLQVNRDTTYFSIRMDEPISLDVRRVDNRIGFYAYNYSQYPYQLELKFKNIRNLMPILENRQFVLDPGPRLSPLVVFNVIDPSISDYHYEMVVNDCIGDSTSVPARSFPYLIPVGNRKKTAVVVAGNTNDTGRVRNIFKMNAGDTVYAMRRGRVTALPAAKTQEDRISSNQTLEILHRDGTVTVYYNLMSDKIFIQAGETVNPGDPVGIINAGGELEVELYEITGKTYIFRKPIYYYTGKNKTSPFADIPRNYTVVYPIDIITREMTEKEKSKYRRGANAEVKND